MQRGDATRTVTARALYGFCDGWKTLNVDSVRLRTNAIQGCVFIGCIGKKNRQCAAR